MTTPTLSSLQESAVKAAASWYRQINPEPFKLTGYAGSGKSTILPNIIESMGLHPDEVAFCAPTGKAAKVMSSKLKNSGFTTRCRTIHSLIYTPKLEKPAVLEKRLLVLRQERDFIYSNPGHFISDEEYKSKLKEKDLEIKQTEKELDRALDKNDHPGFNINLDSDIRTKKLVVVDEASMVGEDVTTDLLSFGIPILAMGDPGQLKPVQDVPGFDLENPDFFLYEIHRQAKDNPIIYLATMAREGEPLKAGDYGNGVKVVYRKNDIYTTDPDMDAQVIVGTHVKRWNVTRAIRKAYGYSGTSPKEGEILIVCKNSKTIPELVNGSFVRCVEDVKELEDGSPYFSVKTEDETGSIRNLLAFQGLFEEHKLRQKNAFTCPKMEAFKARIEREHLDWGWAITCHKSQGSQWDSVIVHDESGTFREEASNWLYTAITRASEKLIVVI